MLTRLAQTTSFELSFVSLFNREVIQMSKILATAFSFVLAVSMCSISFAQSGTGTGTGTGGLRGAVITQITVAAATSPADKIDVEVKTNAFNTSGAIYKLTTFVRVHRKKVVGGIVTWEPVPGIGSETEDIADGSTPLLVTEDVSVKYGTAENPEPPLPAGEYKAVVVVGRVMGGVLDGYNTNEKKFDIP